MMILGSRILPRYSTLSQAPTTVNQQLEAKRRLSILVLVKTALMNTSLKRGHLAILLRR